MAHQIEKNKKDQIDDYKIKEAVSETEIPPIFLFSSTNITTDSFKNGLQTHRVVTIGASTIHDVVNLYGSQIRKVSHQKSGGGFKSTGFVYSDEKA